MPPVHRDGDVTVGHCYPPTPPSSFSGDVKANGKGIVRQGDGIITHCCGIPCHGGSYVDGGTVFVNGRPAQKVGSPVS